MRGPGVLALIAIIALVSAPAADARRPRHHRAATRTKRCRNDKQCPLHGTCNGGGQCCNTFGGEIVCGATCCDTVAGESCCGAACTDLKTDIGNCGGCGVVCDGGTTC